MIMKRGVAAWFVQPVSKMYSKVAEMMHLFKVQLSLRVSNILRFLKVHAETLR